MSLFPLYYPVTKIHFSEDVVRTLLDSITSIGENITPSPSGEILSDMKGLPFYEVVFYNGNCIKLAIMD